MKEDPGVPIDEKVVAREQEQARRYTLSDFSTLAFLLRLDQILISYGNDGLKCSCKIFRDHETCRHLIALKTLVPSFPSFDLKDLLNATKEGQDA